MGLTSPTTLDPNATAQVKGIDRASAATLEVGITNANAISIGKTGTPTTIPGTVSISTETKLGSTAGFTGSALSIKETKEDGTGINCDISLLPDSDPGLSGSGCNIICRGVTAAFAAAEVKGIDVTARHQSTVNGSALVGATIRWLSANGASGTLATATALSIDSPTAVGATTGAKPTNGIGIEVKNQGLAGITTSTALQIKAQSGSTNNLAIDQQGNAARNIFAGSIETTATALTIANGSNNNLALGSQGNHFRATGHTIPSDITGIAGGVSGRRITIVNQGAQYLTLTNEDALSTAANRIQTKTGSRLLLGGGSVSLIYDATSSRWVVDSAQSEIGKNIGSLFVSADHSTASTTYVDLTQADSADFFLEVPGKVQITYNAQMYNSLASTVMSNIVDIDTVDDATSEVNQTSHSTANAQTSTNCMWLSGQLAAGQHTVKIQHKVAAGAGHWLRRQLLVLRVE